jgi:hypothetical protein
MKQENSNLIWNRGVSGLYTYSLLGAQLIFSPFLLPSPWFELRTLAGYKTFKKEDKIAKVCDFLIIFRNLKYITFVILVKHVKTLETISTIATQFISQNDPLESVLLCVVILRKVYWVCNEDSAVGCRSLVCCIFSMACVVLLLGYFEKEIRITLGSFKMCCWRKMEKIVWKKKKNLQRVKEGRNILHAIKIRYNGWFGYILLYRYLLKHVTENKINK